MTIETTELGEREGPLFQSGRAGRKVTVHAHTGPITPFAKSRELQRKLRLRAKRRSATEPDLM